MHLNYFKYTCTLKLKLYNYHRVFASILFLQNFKDFEFCTKVSSFFPCCKTKPVIWQAVKTKELLFTVF